MDWRPKDKTAAAAKSLWVVSDSARLHRRQPTRLPDPGILQPIVLQARVLESGATAFSEK